MNEKSKYEDFIDDDEINRLLEDREAIDDLRLKKVVERSMKKEALSLEETAVLLKADSPEQREFIFDSARKLKERVYGNRVVLFAPLYLGNHCINDCRYCSFRRSNKSVHRHTLSEDELSDQVKALVDKGHKRLILVYGEAPQYDAKFIADTVRQVYARTSGNGEIRRVNINAAPLSVEDYRIVKDAGIGTYQVFQESYHHETYSKFHPQGTKKGDYHWRVTALHRAMEAGCDDVGIGALFGLYDWRFEVLGLVKHALELNRVFGVGPHTISFPRIRPADGLDIEEDSFKPVSDEDFKLIVAVLRLAVPYTGLILTAREEPSLRRELMRFGVSQIDAGSRIEIGGYTKQGDALQFHLGDHRELDEVMAELLEDGYLPSFCTACYRLGRTGEHFMEFAIPGFIKRFCTPNAVATLAEYLADYAGDRCKKAGMALIEKEIADLPHGPRRQELKAAVKRILHDGERDIHF